MPLTTFKAMTRSKGGTQVEGESRGFRVIIDEPEEMSGTDKGMNPVELVLNSLGACQIITTMAYAPQFGVELKDMWVELEGDIDLAGFEGVEGVKSGYQEIRFNTHLVTDSPEEKVKELAATVERICPVGDTLRSNTKLKKGEMFIENMSLI